MPDIFNRRAMSIGSSFSADSAIISFSGTGATPSNGSGLLVQGMSMSYQQPVSRIYELGTNLTYFIAGRVSGNGNMSRVLGPGAVVLSFYQAYGDVCRAQNNVISIFAASSCGDPCTGNTGQATSSGPIKGVRWIITGVVLTNIGMTIAAQDMIINEALGFMFVNLEVCATSQAAPCWPRGSCA